MNQQVSLLPKIDTNNLEPFKLGAEVTVEAETSRNEIKLFFNTITDESKTGSTQITDNFVESNYNIQDHIAIQPRTYKLKGFVAELNYVIPNDFENWLSNKIPENVKNKLTSISSIGAAIFPIVGNYTHLAIEAVHKLNTSFNRYKKIYDLAKQNVKLLGSLQQNTSATLFYLMENRTPVKLTGLIYNTLESQAEILHKSEYYIQSVQVHQGNSRYVSDFEVVLKEVRTAETNYTSVKEVAQTNANAIQATKEANTGIATKTKSTIDDAPRGSYLWLQKQKQNGVYSSTPQDKYRSMISERPSS